MTRGGGVRARGVQSGRPCASAFRPWSASPRASLLSCGRWSASGSSLSVPLQGWTPSVLMGPETLLRRRREAQPFSLFFFSLFISHRSVWSWLTSVLSCLSCPSPVSSCSRRSSRSVRFQTVDNLARSPRIKHVSGTRRQRAHAFLSFFPLFPSAALNPLDDHSTLTPLV